MTQDRLLWLTQSYPTPSSPFAGIFHRTQAEALVRQGALLDIVAPTPAVPPLVGRLPGRWREYADVPLQSGEKGLRVYRPRYFALPKQSVWASPHRAMTRVVKRLGLARPTLMHAHFAYPQGLMAIRLAREFGAPDIPYVLTLHGSDVNVYPDYGSVALARFREAVNGAAEVLAVSGALADRTERLTGRRPHVVPIGIDLGRASSLPDREEARRLLGLPQERFLVLYVGSFFAAKGIRELIAALGRLKYDTAGVFVGDGPLRGEIERCPAAFTAGVQPNERIFAYMAACDMLALPSYREGLPTVLVEAGAAGLPIAATSVGGIPELLADGRGLLMPPQDEEAIVQAIVRVMARPDETRKAAERLRRYISEHYDAGANASRLLALYGDLRRTRTAIFGRN